MPNTPRTGMVSASAVGHAKTRTRTGVGRQIVSVDEYRFFANEASFQKTVVEAAERLGWDVFIFPRMIGNPAGWPDILALRNGVWILRELKTERGRLGPKQAELIERLTANGADVEIWKPEQWVEIESALKGAG